MLVDSLTLMANEARGEQNKNMKYDTRRPVGTDKVEA